MLHITNGESVSIPQTGLPGQVVCWDDILHDGPVPGGLSLQELSRIRERFLAEFLDVPLSEVSFARRDEAITRFHDHEEVILWFEHDLYDQLQLIQILDWFSRRISKEPGYHSFLWICISVPCGPSNSSPSLRHGTLSQGPSSKRPEPRGMHFVLPSLPGSLHCSSPVRSPSLFCAGRCYITCSSSRRCTTAFRERSARSLNSLDPACTNPASSFQPPRGWKRTSEWAVLLSGSTSKGLPRHDSRC